MDKIGMHLHGGQVDGGDHHHHSSPITVGSENSNAVNSGTREESGGISSHQHYSNHVVVSISP